MNGPRPSARPIAVADGSAVGEARRHAVAVATWSGLDERLRGDVAIIATELAVNLHLHGGGGELLVDPLPGAVPGVQILAVDRGPGMDVQRSLVDGYSTAGTAGQGLGAARRLSTRFDAHSQPRQDTIGGTVVLSQVSASAVPSQIEAGAVCVPVAGEQVCGDGWAVHESDGRCAALVVDGLGHGPHAAEAAEVAVRLFRERGSAGPAEYLAQAHARMRATRGGAATFVEIDFARGTTRCAGVGNVAGRILGGALPRGLLTANGTLGLQASRIHEAQYPWNPDSLLVLNSDGLVSGWTADRYPGLRMRHPAVIAAVLYRDWARGRDDATVLVIRRRQPEAPP